MDDLHTAFTCGGFLYLILNVAGVSNIFTKLECDQAVIEDILDTSAGINDTNIMSYLSLIEQKTNELLTVRAYLQSKVLLRGF